ncbi:MAG: alpha-L-fucosidase [Algibacter sp.]|uniref:alpha-L-fucosidase n=1 Tax=Algibacter sp. TaxID=1872428 RepID=UPI00329825E7
MFKIKYLIAYVLLVTSLFSFSQNELKPHGYKTIEPNWESMAKNYQVPEWFQDGKIGVWMHWGIPSSIDENRPEDGSHYGRRMYGDQDYDARNEPDRLRTVKLSEWHAERYGAPSEFGYEKFISDFKAENFDADAIVKFVKESGARFIMPVATHHDNFDMYDSFFPWNSVKMGPKKDILKEWKDAAIKHDLKFGVSTHLYWSPRFFRTARKFQQKGTPEWELFNMDYDTFKFASQDSWNAHWYKRSWDLIEKYDPDMFNNDSPYPSIKTGKGLGVKLFSDYLNRDLKENNGKQTTVLSFKNTKENKAAFTYNLERGMFGEQQKHPWIWATDLSGSWFYRKHSFTKMSLDVLIGNALDAISKNGVVMINIALKGDGTIPNNQITMLSDFGAFVKINQEGIYNTRPWKTFGEGPLEIVTKRAGENLKQFSEKDIRFTTKDGNLFAFVLAPPTQAIVIKTLKNGGVLNEKIKKIELLGSPEKISWTQTTEGLIIKCPNNMPNQPAIGFKITLN